MLVKHIISKILINILFDYLIKNQINMYNLNKSYF